MTLSVTLVDPSSKIRDWLRTQSLAVGVRVYCDGFPKNVTLPAVALSRLGGPIAQMVDLGLYGFEVRDDTAPGVKAAAYELAELLTNTNQEQIHATVRLAGASISALNSITDPDDPTLFRMVVTAQLVTVAN